MSTNEHETSTRTVWSWKLSESRTLDGGAGSGDGVTLRGTNTQDGSRSHEQYGVSVALHVFDREGGQAERLDAQERDRGV